MANARPKPRPVSTLNGIARSSAITDLPQFLSVPECATYLGIGRGLVYELIASGQLISCRLGRLLRVRANAIVEPVDRPPGLIIPKWGHGTDPGTSAPIFLSGDPKDFYCLEPNRFMIVYSDKDVEALERFTPDFHTLELPPIVFNREHNRGYVKYSFGWAGGTLRMRLVNGQWVFDELSSWIT